MDAYRDDLGWERPEITELVALAAQGSRQAIIALNATFGPALATKARILATRHIPRRSDIEEEIARAAARVSPDDREWAASAAASDVLVAMARARRPTNDVEARLPSLQGRTNWSKIEPGRQVIHYLDDVLRLLLLRTLRSLPHDPWSDFVPDDVRSTFDTVAAEVVGRHQ